MKYIIFKAHNLLMPVIIPDHIAHSQIHLKGAKPISAGFFHTTFSNNVTTYGNSESLKLKPLPEDTELIKKALSNFGTSSFLI